MGLMHNNICEQMNILFKKMCLYLCWKAKTEKTQEETRNQVHECRVRDAAPINKVSIKDSVEFPWKLQEDGDLQRQRGDANEEEEQI